MSTSTKSGRGGGTGGGGGGRKPGQPDKKPTPQVGGAPSRSEDKNKKKTNFGGGDRGRGGGGRGRGGGTGPSRQPVPEEYRRPEPAPGRAIWEPSNNPGRNIAAPPTGSGPPQALPSAPTPPTQPRQHPTQVYSLAEDPNTKPTALPSGLPLELESRAPTPGGSNPPRVNIPRAPATAMPPQAAQTGEALYAQRRADHSVMMPDLARPTAQHRAATSVPGSSQPPGSRPASRQSSKELSMTVSRHSSPAPQQMPSSAPPSRPATAAQASRPATPAESKGKEAVRNTPPPSQLFRSMTLSNEPTLAPGFAERQAFEASHRPAPSGYASQKSPGPLMQQSQQLGFGPPPRAYTAPSYPQQAAIQQGTSRMPEQYIKNAGQIEDLRRLQADVVARLEAEDRQKKAEAARDSAESRWNGLVAARQQRAEVYRREKQAGRVPKIAYPWGKMEMWSTQWAIPAPPKFDRFCDEPKDRSKRLLESLEAFGVLTTHAKHDQATCRQFGESWSNIELRARGFLEDSTIKQFRRVDGSTYGLIIHGGEDHHPIGFMSTASVFAGKYAEELRDLEGEPLTFTAALYYQRKVLSLECLVASLCAQLLCAHINLELNWVNEKCTDEVKRSRLPALLGLLRFIVFEVATYHAKKEKPKILHTIVIDGLDILEDIDGFDMIVKFLRVLCEEVRFGELGDRFVFRYALVHPRKSRLAHDLYPAEKHAFMSEDPSTKLSPGNLRQP